MRIVAGLSFGFALGIIQNVHSLVVATTTPSMKFIGVDLGTSGARLSVIQEEQDEQDRKEVYTQAIQWQDDDDGGGSYDDPSSWNEAVNKLLQGAADTISLKNVQSICVSGTSASCLLVEPDGEHDVKPSRSPRMYNYNVDNVEALKALQAFAPARHTALSPTGSLAKLLAWNAEKPLNEKERLCHQADYVTQSFLDTSTTTATSITSDWHNCLKLGYDVRALDWPAWMTGLLQSVGISQDVLPAQVVSPGEPIGQIRSSVAERFGLPEATIMVGGTTDSNAAFFAATGGVATMGTAVTSLGSTLAIKQLSAAYVEDASKGVYSHRFPSSFVDSKSTEAWLVGGASNVGCAVLRNLQFSNDELVELSQDIDPETDSPLSYYPLTGKGERFPVADSDKEPVLEPVPEDRKDFLHGILQGISDVERDGFLALGKLGAEPSTPVHVYTCGGGSRNDMWAKLRQRRLREAFSNEIKVTRADNVEASYGAAILAASSFSNTSS